MKRLAKEGAALKLFFSRTINSIQDLFVGMSSWALAVLRMLGQACTSSIFGILAYKEFTYNVTKWPLGDFVVL